MNEIYAPQTRGNYGITQPLDDKPGHGSTIGFKMEPPEDLQAASERNLVATYFIAFCANSTMATAFFYTHICVKYLVAPEESPEPA